MNECSTTKGMGGFGFEGKAQSPRLLFGEQTNL